LTAERRDELTRLVQPPSLPPGEVLRARLKLVAVWWHDFAKNQAWIRQQHPTILRWKQRSDKTRAGWLKRAPQKESKAQTTQAASAFQVGRKLRLKDCTLVGWQTAAEYALWTATIPHDVLAWGSSPSCRPDSQDLNWSTTNRDHVIGGRRGKMSQYYQDYLPPGLCGCYTIQGHRAYVIEGYIKETLN
jgi:hypothetical protein